MSLATEFKLVRQQRVIDLVRSAGVAVSYWAKDRNRTRNVRQPLQGELIAQIHSVAWINGMPKT